MKSKVLKLIEKYRKELKDIKNSKSYKEDSKIQTVCILREVINDLEKIVK